MNQKKKDKDKLQTELDLIERTGDIATGVLPNTAFNSCVDAKQFFKDMPEILLNESIMTPV